MNVQIYPNVKLSWAWVRSSRGQPIQVAPLFIVKSNMKKIFFNIILNTFLEVNMLKLMYFTS